MNERLENARIIIAGERLRLLDLDSEINPIEFALAERIARHSPDNPVSLQTLSTEFDLDERGVKDTVRTLRTLWLLPIGSSRTKGRPQGYYFCLDLNEFQTWLTSFLKQPLDELRTIKNLATRHYPEFSGQLTLPTIKNEEVSDGSNS